MREKDLPFDRTKHACYTKKAKKCVQKLRATLIREGTCCTGACCQRRLWDGSSAWFFKVPLGIGLCTDTR